MAEHVDPQTSDLRGEAPPPSLRHKIRETPARPARNGAAHKRRERAKWIKRGLGLLLALAVIGAIVWAAMPTPVGVELGRVERGPLTVTVEEDGMTRVKDRYSVLAPQAGELQRIELEAGDQVQQGQVVAQLLPPEPALLDVRTRTEAQSRVQATQAALQRARASVGETEANQALAQQELSRIQRLSATGAATRQELDRAQAQARSAKAQVESARFAVQQAQGELAQAQAALARVSGERTGNAPLLEVRSPVSGRVLKVNRQSAGAIRQGEPLLEIGDPAQLEIVTDVLTSDAVEIKPGAPVLIERWGGPKPLRGHVDRIEPSAFTKTSALGVEEQRVNVITRIDDPREQWSSLGDAFRVETSITIWRGDNVLQAPASAVFRHGNGWAVYEVVNGRAQLREVQVGQRNPQEVQILKGLQPGNTVILYPSDQIKDGVRVERR